jgi:gliding motility-associated-like protein
LTINNMDTITIRSVSLEAGIDMEICEGQQVQLNALGNAQQFSWNPILSLSNPNLSNPIASPVSDIMYYVYHSDGVCDETDSVFIKVNDELPTTSFSTMNTCDGDTVQFSASSGLLTANISWEWSFGSSIQNPLQELALGTHDIQLVTVNLDNNCSDTLVQQVEIYPLPIADFSAPEVCFGEPALFTNNSSINTVSWEYNFADGIGTSTNQSPTYIYGSSGVFNVNLNIISDNGCKDNSIIDVIVNELPITNFSVQNHCEGEGNIFTDLSSVINGEISFIEYKFNNGSVSSDSITTNIFNGVGLFDVELTATTGDGCESTITKQTEVFANPIVDFSILGVCEGDQTIFNAFSSVVGANILYYNWTFGLDGFSSDNTTSHIFSSDGIHNVILAITSDQGCISEISKKINIHKLPSVNFEVLSDVCLGNEVAISYLPDGSGENIVEWNYTFGDKNTSVDSNPIHTYSFINEFDISLEVISYEGCVNDTTMPAIIKVHPLPIADFYASTLIASEIESEISFYNKSEGATSYIWSFDNGDYSFEENPSYDFIDVQNYNVSLTATDDFGCQSEVTRIVNIHPEYTIFIPNSFTPDSDGLNDVFEAAGTGIEEFEMKVFDRWGGLIFESSNIDLGWDGNNYSGLPIDNGVYLYHVALYDYNGRVWVYNGDINLTR